MLFLMKQATNQFYVIHCVYRCIFILKGKNTYRKEYFHISHCKKLYRFYYQHTYFMEISTREKKITLNFARCRCSKGNIFQIFLYESTFYFFIVEYAKRIRMKAIEWSEPDFPDKNLRLFSHKY